MSRPQTKYDRFPGFLAAATADTATARLAAIDRALASGIGHKLFTVLVVNWGVEVRAKLAGKTPQ